MPAVARYRLIVAGVDFSEPSRQAMMRALDLGKRLRCPVDVIHVAQEIRPAVPFSRLNRAIAAELQEDELEACEKQLERFVPKKAGVRVRRRVLMGLPNVELLAYATRARADLIVLANHGRTIGERLLLGSVADRVLRKARVPVLLVPGAAKHPRRKSSAARRR